MSSVYVSVTHQRRVSEGGNLVQLVAFLPLSSVYGLVKRELFYKFAAANEVTWFLETKCSKTGYEIQETVLVLK